MKFSSAQFESVGPDLWRLAPQGEMRVGVVLVGSSALLSRLGDQSIAQAMNVASLPGVLDPVLTMPDIHQGYGFPIGGVAAFDRRTGCVSPGGVGYDINCGVRLLRTSLQRDSLPAPLLRRLVDRLFETIPTGVGCRRRDLSLKATEMEALLERGASWAVGRGFGTEADIAMTESRGQFPGAHPDAVSSQAKSRGQNQLGTLGSGNHFVEIQVVDQVLDSKAAEAYQLEKGQVVVCIHTGSRGLGYQVCADALESTMRAARRAGWKLPGKELASAPLTSPEGKAYLQAMGAAANFAFANRQILTHWVRDALHRQWKGCRVETVYDVCHNIAREEQLDDQRGRRSVLVHRKGATRALPPGHSDLPPEYRAVGQPVLVPGDMGRASFVLAGSGRSSGLSFYSACHGAGRELSRSAAKKRATAGEAMGRLKQSGIYLRTDGKHTAVEEMPEAYKDATEVTESVARAGIARPVARLLPLGLIKG